MHNEDFFFTVAVRIVSLGVCIFTCDVHLHITFFYLLFNVLLFKRRHIEMIELTNDGKGLGFGIVGGRSTGVMVKTILPGGAAGQVNTLTSKITENIQHVSNNTLTS